MTKYAAVVWRSNYRALAHVVVTENGRDVTAEVARTLNASRARSGALRVVITPGATDAQILADLHIRLERAAGRLS